MEKWDYAILYFESNLFHQVGLLYRIYWNINSPKVTWQRAITNFLMLGARVIKMKAEHIKYYYFFSSSCKHMFIYKFMYAYRKSEAQKFFVGWYQMICCLGYLFFLYRFFILFIYLPQTCIKGHTVHIKMNQHIKH